MAYRFALDETSQDGLRRIAHEQVSKIVVRLAGDRKTDAMVHDCRKALKRLKALFKLVRGGLSKPVYNREYGVIRDAGRVLSGARDLEVLPVTLATLRAVQPAIDDVTVDHVSQAIDQVRADRALQDGNQTRSNALIRELEAAGRRYARLRLSDTSFAALEHGVAGGLHKLCRQHQLAVESGEDEAYHDWRKSAQLHWRQLRLLSDCWPGLLAARITVGKGLADVLGHDHDLSVLAQFVSSIPASQLKASRRKALLNEICDRQHVLRAEARAYAGLLVTDKPERFAASLSAYHKARARIDLLQAPLCDVFKLPRAT